MDDKTGLKDTWSGHVTYLHYIFGAPMISETAESRVVKFCRSNISSVSTGMTKYPHWASSRLCNPIFKILAHNHIFANGDARHFQFSELIDTNEYRTDYPQKGCVWGHSTSFNFGK